MIDSPVTQTDLLGVASANADRPLRVLMVCPELPREQSPGSMAATARQFDSLKDLGLELTVVDMHGIPKVKYLQAIGRIRRLAEEVDLVHAHFGYCGWLAKFQSTKPIVLSFMGSDVYGDATSSGRPTRYSAAVAWVNRKLLADRVSAIIVKSQEMADLVAPLPTTIIPNGVDTELFRPMDKLQARKQLGWAEDRCYVLFPGNPANPRKGHDLARATLEKLNRQRDNPVEMKVLWGVEPNEVATCMNACDAMLMVSHAEGSPNVVKEAMACNTPIVSVVVGDTEELLNGVVGCVLSPRCEERLATALQTILDEKQPAQGRQRILDRGLTLKGVAQKVRAVYDNVLSGQGHNCG